MRLAVVLAKLCATESPTIFATYSGNWLIGIPYRLAMIGQWARLFTQLTTSDGVGARLFELGLEALQLDFFNHCRDLRLLCNEVDLFYRSLNNRVDFLGKTTPSLIGPRFVQKYRDRLSVVMGFDPTVDCSWIPRKDPAD